MPERSGGEESHAGDDELAKVIQLVRKALQGLRFGEIVLSIQDGVVVQLERTERTRLAKASRR
jgi:hypothetical protein